MSVLDHCSLDVLPKSWYSASPRIGVFRMSDEHQHNTESALEVSHVTNVILEKIRSIFKFLDKIFELIYGVWKPNQCHKNTTSFILPNLAVKQTLRYACAECPPSWKH